MKKDYNRDVMSDMPVDNSFTPSVETKTTKKTTTKPKINAIGTQKRTTTSTKSTSSKSTTSKTASKTTKTSKTKESKVEVQEEVKDKKLRTKLINTEEELSDLEKLNEENIKSYRFKSKRNRVFIALLSVLLGIAIASIIIYLSISKLKTNCNLHIHGDVSASFIVDGQEMDEFRSPSNLQGNRIFELNIKVRINTDEYYDIKFKPNCYQKGVLMTNTLIYEHNTDLFYDGGDGYYYSIVPIRGNQTIELCDGIILDYAYEESLNVDNFRMDFDVYFEKV